METLIGNIMFPDRKHNVSATVFPSLSRAKGLNSVNIWLTCRSFEGSVIFFLQLATQFYS